MALFTLVMVSGGINASAEGLFNNGNRYLRWRVDNQTVASVNDFEPGIGSVIVYRRNDSLVTQKWRFDGGNNQIIGLNDLCLSVDLSNTRFMILDECSKSASNNISWYFDEFGRVVSVVNNIDTQLVQCIEIGAKGDLFLNTCAQGDRNQLFELEGVGVTKDFASIEALVSDSDDGMDGGVMNGGDSMNTLVDVIAGRDEFSTLEFLLTEADLVDAVDTIDMATVFAPTNDALAGIPGEIVNALLLEENKSVLQSILLYHVSGETLPSGELVNRNSVETLQGESVSVDSSNGIVLNGMVNVINDFDINADNGVVHSIDMILLPSSVNLDDLVMDNGEGDDMMEKTLVDIVVEREEFSTLEGLLVQADLVDVVANLDSATVFAPTNDAFNQIPQEILGALTLDANQSILQSILAYHVVDEALPSNILINRDMVGTLNGDNIDVMVDNEGIFLNTDTMVIADFDLDATNGVLHTIDLPLLPPSVDLGDLVLDGDENGEVSTGELVVLFPTEGVSLNGTQTFQAFVENHEPSEYEIFWQVDGDRLNPMFEIGNGEQAFVDFGGWNWNGNGPYNINFVAFDMDGDFIDEESVNIFVP